MDPTSSPQPAPQESLSNTPQPAPIAPPAPQVQAPQVPPVPSAPTPPLPPAPQATVAPGTVVMGDGGLSPTPGANASQGPAFQPTMNPLANGGAPAGPSKRRFPKAALVSVGVIVALLGASAAAYVGVVVPNQPANQLKTALVNSVQEKQESFKGTLSADQTDGSFSMKMDMNGKYNADKKAVDMNTDVTVSGVKLSVDVRFIDQSIYLKTSDLNTIAALASGYSPEAGNLVKSVSSTISNKWIEVDSTLLKQAGASCVLDSSWNFTDADVDLLTNQYKDNQFATIKSSSSDTVNGASATKFNLTIDNKKADKYFNSLKDLSMVKSLQKCSAGKELSGQAADSSASKGTTDLTIWVDKATKHVAQIGYETPSAQAAKDGTKANLKMSFDYKPVNIEKPTGATPVMDIFAQLQSQLGGLDLTSLIVPGANQKAEDSARQANLGALQTQLEVFYQNNGYYPSLADMNNASWRAANMKNLDSNALQDPKGSSQTLAAAPAPNVIAYQTTSASGGGCEKDHTTCASYTLTATLSDGTAYTKQNLD